MQSFGFFEDGRGNKSSSRLIGFTTVLYALLQSTVIIVLGYLEGSSVIATAGASSANFAAIAGPAMVYLYSNKRRELESNGNSK